MFAPTHPQVQLILEGPQGGSVEVNGTNHLDQTALHVAVQFAPLASRSDVCRLLLAHGANPNLRDQYGRSAVRHASGTSQHALAQWLLSFTPVPGPARATPSRLVAAIGAGSKPVEVYGAHAVPNKWVSGGQATAGDRRPAIATRRGYSGL